MTDFDVNDRPNALPWPPLLFGGLALLAVAVHLFWPLPWFIGFTASALRAAGALLAAVGLVLDLAAARELHRHCTTILPHRGAAHLVTSGPFSWSRNPIYLGNTLLLTGAGLAFGVAWLLPAALMAALITQMLAIAREERHLAAMFGAAWTAYAARVGRWFGRRTQ